MYQKLLLTGAAGDLGGYLRAHLRPMCKTLVVSDLNAVTSLQDNEEFVQCDLADADVVARAVDGCDAIVHFGGASDEVAWDAILAANIVGSRNLWQAAHRAGCRRIVYASSIHAVGMYPVSTVLRSDAPTRPDTNYGLSKAFTENLATLYYDQYGLQTVSIRICSCKEKPEGERDLSTWLSYGDLARATIASLQAPSVGHTTLFGVSANARCGYDNSPAGFIGYDPQDNAENYASDILKSASAPVTSTRLDHRHGGPYAKMDIG